MAGPYDTGELDSKEVVPPSQEGIPDYSQGYEITLCVYPDGFRVKGPNPLPQTPDEDEEEHIPDLATALKHVIALHKEHPLDTDMQAHFDAGFAEEEA